MIIHLRHTLAAVAIVCVAGAISAWPVVPVRANDKAPTSPRTVTVGAFTVQVPTEWKEFDSSESADLRRQYLAQSRELYQRFSGQVGDPANSVDVAAFDIPGSSGTFALVAMTVPPQSNLIKVLRSQVDDKMTWGIRQGYIRTYLGVVPVNFQQLSGFYTKAIGKDGGIEVSGGLEHKKLKNTIIQLTLLCPQTWKESEATTALSSILKSVALEGK